MLVLWSSSTILLSPKSYTVHEEALVRVGEVQDKKGKDYTMLVL